MYTVCSDPAKASADLLRAFEEIRKVNTSAHGAAWSQIATNQIVAALASLGLPTAASAGSAGELTLRAWRAPTMHLHLGPNEPPHLTELAV